MQLNSKSFVPGRGFRRNVTLYELVCYINNIVACYVSKNAEPIPVFIACTKAYIASDLSPVVRATGGFHTIKLAGHWAIKGSNCARLSVLRKTTCRTDPCRRG